MYSIQRNKDLLHITRTKYIKITKYKTKSKIEKNLLKVAQSHINFVMNIKLLHVQCSHDNARIRIVDKTTLRKLCRDKNTVSCNCRLKYIANVAFSSAFFMNGNAEIYRMQYQSHMVF